MIVINKGSEERSLDLFNTPIVHYYAFGEWAFDVFNTALMEQWDLKLYPGKLFYSKLSNGQEVTAVNGYGVGITHRMFELSAEASAILLNHPTKSYCIEGHLSNEAFSRKLKERYGFGATWFETHRCMLGDRYITFVDEHHIE